MPPRHASRRQAARRVLLLALACCAGAGAATGTIPLMGGPAMNQETRTQVMALLTLPDDAYFALDAKADSELTQRLARTLQPPPLSLPPGRESARLPELRVITAPARIDLQRRQSFPLLIAEVRGNRREWEVASRQNRQVIIANLGTGDVLAAGARDRGRRMPQLPPSRSGPPVDDFNAALSTIAVTHRDVLKWVPPEVMRSRMQGRLALTLLDYDLPSNTRLIDTRETIDPPIPVPVDAKPRLRPNSEAFAADSSALGVTLVALAGLAPSMPSTQAALRADFRLKRSEVTLLQGDVDARHRQFAAASLVLVQLDSESSIVLDLAVGIDAKAADVGIVQSAFMLDLNGRVAPGDYVAYLVIGDTVTGPAPVTVSGR